jgi:hypothetical protein
MLCAFQPPKPITPISGQRLPVLLCQSHRNSALQHFSPADGLSAKTPTGCFIEAQHYCLDIKRNMFKIFNLVKNYECGNLG